MAGLFLLFIMLIAFATLANGYVVSLKDSRWDRYLGMTAAMTQVPVPTARASLNFSANSSSKI